jgi:hypothetical protein
MLKTRFLAVRVPSKCVGSKSQTGLDRSMIELPLLAAKREERAGERSSLTS